MRLIEKVWFKQHRAKYWLVPLLLPLSGVFYLLSATRRLAYKLGLFKSIQVSKPVIVVGNIGIGGNGKTPIVVDLVQRCKALGFNPGVISRGYGAHAKSYPYMLDKYSTSLEAGDEPLLIYQRCQVPVAIGADRIANAQCLIKQGCDIIISDDGLQHYRLHRDIELVVVDGNRLFGNGLLLPAGPLREGVWRLPQADLVVFNGGQPEKLSQLNPSALLMTLAAVEVIQIHTGKRVLLADFLTAQPTVNALAGIGDPQRFFDTLHTLGFTLSQQQGFIDHKDFALDDFNQFKTDLPLLMTEKDAVKCQAFACEHWWYLPVSAHFGKQDAKTLQAMLKALAK